MSEGSNCSASVFKARILLSQIENENFECSHWIRMAVECYLRDNPDMKLIQFLDELTSTMPKSKVSVGLRNYEMYGA